MRSYQYFIHLVWDPPETLEVVYIHMRAQVLDTILLETCIRTWYLLHEKLVSNMNF